MPFLIAGFTTQPFETGYYTACVSAGPSALLAVSTARCQHNMPQQFYHLLKRQHLEMTPRSFSLILSHFQRYFQATAYLKMRAKALSVSPFIAYTFYMVPKSYSFLKISYLVYSTSTTTFIYYEGLDTAGELFAFQSKSKEIEFLKRDKLLYSKRETDNWSTSASWSHSCEVHFIQERMTQRHKVRLHLEAALQP
uniref:Uncharacterized protein n=1 Tax=Corvus moneduloides TaxID=1196302 RepID=A0A8C3GSA6_CORMO